MQAVDKSDDTDLKRKIDQIIELTNATRDQAQDALHDCDYDTEKAVDWILDNFDKLASNQWKSAGKKKNKQQSQAAKQAAGKNSSSPHQNISNAPAQASHTSSPAAVSGDKTVIQQTASAGGDTHNNKTQNYHNTNRQHSDNFTSGGPATSLNIRRGGGRGGGTGRGGARNTVGTGRGGYAAQIHHRTGGHLNQQQTHHQRSTFGSGGRGRGGVSRHYDHNHHHSGGSTTTNMHTSSTVNAANSTAANNITDNDCSTLRVGQWSDVAGVGTTSSGNTTCAVSASNDDSWAACNEDNWTDEADANTNVTQQTALETKVFTPTPTSANKSNSNANVNTVNVNVSSGVDVAAAKAAAAALVGADSTPATSLLHTAHTQQQNSNSSAQTTTNQQLTADLATILSKSSHAQQPQHTSSDVSKSTSSVITSSSAVPIQKAPAITSLINDNARAVLMQQQQQSGVNKTGGGLTPLGQFNMSQYNKEASESLKSLVGITSSATTATTGDNSQGLSSGVGVKQGAVHPQHHHHQNHRVNQNRPVAVRSSNVQNHGNSAVEMPNVDGVSSLNVQFGALEFGHHNPHSHHHQAHQHHHDVESSAHFSSALAAAMSADSGTGKAGPTGTSVGVNNNSNNNSGSFQDVLKTKTNSTQNAHHPTSHSHTHHLNQQQQQMNKNHHQHHHSSHHSQHQNNMNKQHHHSSTNSGDVGGLVAPGLSSNQYQSRGGIGNNPTNNKQSQSPSSGIQTGSQSGYQQQMTYTTHAGLQPAGAAAFAVAAAAANIMPQNIYSTAGATGAAHIFNHPHSALQLNNAGGVGSASSGSTGAATTTTTTQATRATAPGPYGGQSPAQNAHSNSAAAYSSAYDTALNQLNQQHQHAQDYLKAQAAAASYPGSMGLPPPPHQPPHAPPQHPGYPTLAYAMPSAFHNMLPPHQNIYGAAHTAHTIFPTHMTGPTPPQANSAAAANSAYGKNAATTGGYTANYSTGYDALNAGVPLQAEYGLKPSSGGYPIGLQQQPNQQNTGQQQAAGGGNNNATNAVGNSGGAKTINDLTSNTSNNSTWQYFWGQRKPEL